MSLGKIYWLLQQQKKRVGPYWVHESLDTLSVRLQKMLVSEIWG